MREPLKIIPETWKGILPVLIVLIENGDSIGKKKARLELERMAEAADAYNTILLEKEMKKA